MGSFNFPRRSIDSNKAKDDASLQLHSTQESKHGWSVTCQFKFVASQPYICMYVPKMTTYSPNIYVFVYDVPPMPPGIVIGPMQGLFPLPAAARLFRHRKNPLSSPVFDRCKFISEISSGPIHSL
jgi:hypothetical protein